MIKKKPIWEVGLVTAVLAFTMAWFAGPVVDEGIVRQLPGPCKNKYALTPRAEAAPRHFMNLGDNPCHKGGYTDEQATAMGWELIVFDEDMFLTMGGASGEWVSGWLPAGTRCGAKKDGAVVLLDCGNPTDLLVRFRDRWHYEYLKIEVPVPYPVEKIRRVYTIPPAVIAVGTLQSQMTFVERPPSYVNLTALIGQGPTTNIGGPIAAGGGGGTGGTATSNAWAEATNEFFAWLDNRSSSTSWNSMTLEQRTDLALDFINTNYNHLSQQQQNELLSQIMNQNPINVVTGEGSSGSVGNGGAQNGNNREGQTQ